MTKAFEYKDFEEAELAYHVHLMDGWEVTKPIKIKWSWRKFTFVFRFTMQK